MHKYIQKGMHPITQSLMHWLFHAAAPLHACIDIYICTQSDRQTNRHTEARALPPHTIHAHSLHPSTVYSQAFQEEGVVMVDEVDEFDDHDDDERRRR